MEARGGAGLEGRTLWPGAAASLHGGTISASAEINRRTAISVISAVVIKCSQIMRTSGSFIKGKKSPNQGKRGPGKVPSQARAALAAFAEHNAGRLQGWLDEVAERDGPAAAIGCYVRLLEFIVPKVARQELVGDDAGPLEVVVTWMSPPA